YDVMSPHPHRDPRRCEGKEGSYRCPPPEGGEGGDGGDPTGGGGGGRGGLKGRQQGQRPAPSPARGGGLGVGAGHVGAADGLSPVGCPHPSLPPQAGEGAGGGDSTGG